MQRSNAGFREIEHTADWELEAWAPDLPGLLEQAARGMYSLAGIVAGPGNTREYRLEMKAPDAESLLVNFLAELLYLEEDQGLAFDGFDLQLRQTGEYQLEANLVGSPALSREKDIKAVTYHKIKVERGQRGLEVRIVFDV